MSITQNLELVKAKINASCHKSGRKREDVTLIAVSKTKPTEDILEIFGCGQNIFGENKVQELKKKSEILSSYDIHWHMIGHLQLNKVKYLMGVVDMIHSVDSLKLAREIDKQSARHGLITDILCEVNVSGEESKFGLDIEKVPEFVKSISSLSNIRLKGLMTVAPYTDNPETNRPFFKTLKDIMDEINKKGIKDIKMDTLSMGMTKDYEVAIEEGATMVRIGTAIFGERDYTL